MATVDLYMDAPPARVFEILSDGWTYSNWVVGTSHMRAVDAAWPAVGSKIHHTAGIWPLAISDESVVEEIDPGRYLKLTVRGRPVGEAVVELRLQPEGSGTRVTIYEEPIKGPGKWVHNPLSEAVLTRRNVETLERLRAIAERRTEPA